MSLALVVENELWGLLAFHGYNKPFKPSLHQRIACETIASMVSVRLEAVIKKVQSTRVIALGGIMLSLKQEHSPLQNLRDWGEGLLEIFDADVIAANVSDLSDGKGDFVVLGDKSLVPTKTFWTKMKLAPNREPISMSTRAAIDARHLTKEECPPCGVVYFQENRIQVMIGRKERSREVIWAGNPDEPKLKIGGILCPRSSFDQFMEKVSY
jgi:light-regulated signal transduction histidine kinase (bacteriophytochrome)